MKTCSSCALETGYNFGSNRILSLWSSQKLPVKIIDGRCAINGNSAIVRIITAAGSDGYGQGEDSKPHLKPHIIFYKAYVTGEDSTDVERSMLKIWRLGGSKP